MEVQELRIGNYLIIDGVLVRVRSVYSFTNGSFKNNEGTVEAYRYDSIFEPKKISAGINRFEPIPLTKDWNLKLSDDEFEFVGFGTRLIYQHKIHKAIKLECTHEQVAVYFNDNLISFKDYLHELQNFIFELTNEEITIKK
jgi:hypothetical protein